MPINLDSQGNVEGQGPIPDLYPAGSLPKLKRLGQEGQIQDVEAPSKEKMAETICRCDAPQPALPDQTKLREEDVQKAVAFIKEDKWFSSITPFLSTFFSAMYDLIKIEGEIYQKEAKAELETRHQIFVNTLSSAELAKQLQDNKAQEHMTQALFAFASAGASLFQAMQTTRNMGTAKREYKADVARQEAKLQKLERKPLGFEKDATGKWNHTTGMPFNEKAIKAQVKTHPYEPDDLAKITKERKALDKLINNESALISEKTRHLDAIAQHQGDALKQTFQGTQGVLLASIATDTGVKEALKIMIDGFNQALNRYLDSVAESKKKARADSDQFIEFMNRIIASAYKAQHLSGQA